MNTKVQAAIAAVLLVLVLLFLGALIGGFIIKLAWNATLPFIFGLPAIDYIHGFWLNILAWMLFRSNVSVNKDED